MSENADFMQSLVPMRRVCQGLAVLSERRSHFFIEILFIGKVIQLFICICCV